MTSINRKTFLAASAATSALAAAEGVASAAESGPVFVNTWSDSYVHLPVAARVFNAGGSLLDAVEKMINAVEDDTAITSVGYGGLPNAEGEVELDAAIMSGTTRRAGSICNLHHIKNPVSVARLVMEKTRHTTMAGEGAYQFARELGFEPMQLLTPKSLEAWLQWKNDPNHVTYWLPGQEPKHGYHDTVGLLGYDGKGHVVSGCSTSGIAFKLPGRVADSPIVGCGVYADDAVGAATATGDGDVMTIYCTSFFVVMLMGRGLSPQEACEECLRHIARSDASAKRVQAAVVAIDNRGNVGAASMRTSDGFQYGVWRNGNSALHKAVALY